MTSTFNAPVAHPSLRAALRSLIDYAGMYPPAGLPLATAWDNYSAYRGSADAWMLGHFVMPAGEVESLAKLLHDRPAVAKPSPQLPSASQPLTLAVVCRLAPSERQWLDALETDLQSAASAIEASGGQVGIAAVEAKLPDDVVHAADPSATAACAVAAVARSRAAAPNAAIFLEAPLDGGGKSSIEPQFAGLAKAADDTGATLGFKLRAGGLQAAAFPSVEQMATAVDACRRHRLPWKATAGLHHPIRQHRDEVHAPMHGFINLLAATVLAEAHGLPIAEIAAILADQSTEHFHFDAAGLSWNDRTASTAQVEIVRRERFISFGSCSFDEPLADLRSLGWLER